jgi:chromosome segregation ATPase
MKRLLLIFIWSFVFFNVTTLQAEEEQVGRLSDGRAYRVDQEGNEIVDYIAELELSKDALQRQIYGLEGELKEKNRLLESRNIASASGRSEILEKDLKSGVIKTIQQDCSSVVDKALASSNQRNDELNREVATYQAKLQNYQIREASSDDNNQQLSKLEGQLADALANSSECQGRYEKLKVTSQEEIEGAKREIENVQGDLSNEVSQLRGKLIEANHREKEKEEEIGTLKLRLVENERRINSISQQNSAILARANVEGQPNKQPTVSDARKQALEILRNRVNVRLNSVRSSLALRDSLYSKYRASSRALRIDLKKAVSSRGLELRDIQERLRKVTSIVELSTLSRDLTEIETRVREDIALLERLLRSK